MVPVEVQGHLKSQRWFEFTAVVQVKIKHCRGTHLSRVKLTWSELSLPWQNSSPLSGLARRLFRIRRRFPRSDPPSKAFTVSKLSGLLDAFLSPIVRIDVYWYSPGLYDLEWRREFEAILEGNLLPFTRTWPVVIWEQLNNGFPILLRSLIFNIFHTLKRNFTSPRAHIISSISFKHSTVNKSSIRVLNGGSMWGTKIRS